MISALPQNKDTSAKEQHPTDQYPYEKSFKDVQRSPDSDEIPSRSPYKRRKNNDGTSSPVSNAACRVPSLQQYNESSNIADESDRTSFQGAAEEAVQLPFSHTGQHDDTSNDPPPSSLPDQSHLKVAPALENGTKNFNHVNPSEPSKDTSVQQCSFNKIDDSSRNEEVHIARKLRERKPQRVQLDEPLAEVMQPLTGEERHTFSGWVEVESDPALFEYILRQDGVKNVRIQEIYDMQSMAGAVKSSKTHGIIFLFQYGENDAQEWTSTSKCPKEIWFANQVVDNACATVALMNIVMNSERLDVGSYLEGFRQRTKLMKPIFRGRALGKDKFIRSNHNSFMRRMEMLNANLYLQQESVKHEKAHRAQASRRQRKTIESSAKSRAKAAKLPSRKRTSSQAEDGFHYIAFVPLHGSVWRFDGLLQEPTNIGTYTDDWLSVAQTNIESRINYGEQTHFNLMALCDDPLYGHKLNLADIVKSGNVLERKMNEMNRDWLSFADREMGSPPQELMKSCGLSKEDIDKAQVLESVRKALSKPTPTVLLDLRNSLARDQLRIENEYMAEVSDCAENSEVVTRRLHDLTPDVYLSLRKLSELGLLKGIANEVKITATTSSPDQDGWEVFPACE